MNARTIQKLRRKFILISTLAYFLVMLFMGTCINVSNIILSEQQFRIVLDTILENNGNLSTYNRSTSSESTAPGTSSAASRPENPSDSESSENDGSGFIDVQVIQEITKNSNNSILEEFSPEFHYSARYFTAVFDEAGELLKVSKSHVRELTQEQAAMVAKAAYAKGSRYGRLGFYYFGRAATEDGGTIIALLNCSSQLRANQRILTITAAICILGLLITLVLVWFFSSTVIRPEIENVRRQKQFITNASHELKTPLAVIRANTEIEEMINGQSEWIESTMRQIERLDGLVQNLVMISRAEEAEDRSVLTEIDVSKNVEESVSPYRSLSQQEKKRLVIDIAPGVTMTADESKIRQLATLLIDNAFKYCDSGGTIRVILDTMKKGKTVRLIVANTFAAGANVDYSRFFERFYREDEARNIEKGGYGIGLSIAESICLQYNGSITAAWKNGEIAFTCLLN